MKINKFSFKLNNLPVELPKEEVVINYSGDTVMRPWVPFAAESDPETGTVWIWAMFVEGKENGNKS